jgi:hypothetical protein
MHLSKKIFQLVAILLIQSCSSVAKFEKLIKPVTSDAGLYIIRPSDPTLSLYSYTISVSKYEGHFISSPSPTILFKWNYRNADYCYFHLKPGYYLLKIEENNYEKIVFLEKNNTLYFSFVIINQGAFNLPDFYIQEINKSQALNYLLSNNHLDKCGISMD